MPTYDTSGGAIFTGTSSSITIASFTIGSNSNRVLFVTMWGQASFGSGGTYPYWNGTIMTLVSSGATASPGINWATYILVAPSTGNHNLTCTSQNGLLGGVLYYSLYNCSQTQLDNTGSTNGTTTALSLSITPSNDSDMVLFFGLANNTTGTLTGAGATNQASESFEFGTTNTFGIIGNSGSISPPSSKTATLNVTSCVCNLFAFCIKPILQNATVSASILNGASRTVTTSRSQVLARTMADSVMNAASRLATLTKGISRSLSVSIMNAASRFVTIISKGGIWLNNTKDSTTFTTQTKDASSWVNQSKDSSSLTNLSKS